MTKQITASKGLISLAGRDLLARLEAVATGMSGNSAYPSPPVDLAILKAAGASYSASIAAALDGGKKAINERNTQRENVIKILRQLARYVEMTCKDDMTTFLSSGFEAVSTSRVPPQALAPASIRSVDQGNIGQLLVSAARVVGARSYEVRSGAVPASGGTPASWSSIGFTNARTATPVNNLTPGTTYIFQVRALGPLGYTDWSDPIARMCT